MRIKTITFFLTCILFLFVGTTLLAQEEEEKIEPESYEKGIPLGDLPGIRKLFQEASGFPKGKSKKSCKQLVQYGDVIVPSIDYYLKKGNWRQKAAMAYIAQDLHSKALLQGLSFAAKDPKVTSYLKYFFEALLNADLVPAQHVILTYVKHRKSSVRWLATRKLEPILSQELEETLLDYLRADKISNKKNILTLLGVHRNNKLIPEFLKYLNHKNQETCFQAATELSKFNDEGLIDTLLSNFDHQDYRLKGYSILTLVLLQDHYRIQIFDKDVFLLFLKNLRSPQEFIRYTSAIGLSSINDTDLNIELSLQDEIALLNNLIQACMGNKYFQDYQSVRNLGLAKLQKVTGKNFRADPVKWKEWWEDNKGIFRIIKKLRTVSPAAIDKVQIFYETEGNEPEKYLFSVEAKESLYQQNPLAKIRIISSSDLLQIIQKFKENGYFEMKSNYGLAEAQIGWLRTIRVVLESQKRSVTVRTGFHHQEFETIELLLEDTAKKNMWQKYWSKGYGGDWRDWWYTNYHWFQAAENKMEINARIKTLIIENLPYSLTREEDLKDLKNLVLEIQNSEEVNPETFEPLTIWELSRLVQFIIHQKQVSNTTDFLIECICLSQNDKILEPLFGHLLKAEVYGTKARTYLSLLVENFGRKAVLRYLVDSDWRLRSAAAEVAWKAAFSDDLEIQALLRKRLSIGGNGVEQNDSVRQSLIYAVGLTGKTQKEGSDRLEELYLASLRKMQHRPKIDEKLAQDFTNFTKYMLFRYENMNLDEQKKLLSALQGLFGLKYVTSSKYGLTIAPSTNLTFKKKDIIALKEVIDITKNWDVTLLQKQLTTKKPSIIRSTIAALGSLGTERALGILTEYLGSSDPSYRAEAVKALGKTKKSTYLTSVLNGLLRDPSPRVNQIASQVLSEWGGSTVVSELLRELKSSNKVNSRRIIIDTLGNFANDSILPELKPYLEDEDLKVRVLTAAFFAQFNELSVIPLLIESIGKGNDYVVFQALSKLTCQNFKGTPEKIIIRYKHWWEENRLLGQRHWFFNALKENGYPVDELLEYISGNNKDTAGVPVLLKAIKDPRWYLRYNASLALENISGIKNNRMTQQKTAEERETQTQIWYQWWEKQ